MSQIQLERAKGQDSAGTTPLLEIRDLTLDFKSRSLGRSSRVRAVDTVSLRLSRSEVFSMVGESGSGKTSIARAISALIRPTSGSILFEGIDVDKLSRSKLKGYRAAVQMVYQDPFESLNPRHTVVKALSMPIRNLVPGTPRSAIDNIVSSLLEEVGLVPSEVIEKFPHQLSGGERQRINVARALAPNPKLLIADEPTTMLDAEQRINILSLIMDLKLKRNLTVLLITHDLAAARIISDRIGVLYMGKLVELGDARTVLETPLHPYVELMKSAIPRINGGSPQEYDASFEGAVKAPSGCVYAPRCKYATELCKEVEPKLEEKSYEHFVACYNPLLDENL